MVSPVPECWLLLVSAVRHLRAPRFTRGFLRAVSQRISARHRDGGATSSEIHKIRGIALAYRIVNSENRRDPISHRNLSAPLVRKLFRYARFMIGVKTGEGASMRPTYALRWFPGRFKIIRSFPAERQKARPSRTTAAPAACHSK